MAQSDGCTSVYPLNVKRRIHVAKEVECGTESGTETPSTVLTSGGCLNIYTFIRTLTPCRVGQIIRHEYTRYSTVIRSIPLAYAYRNLNSLQLRRRRQARYDTCSCYKCIYSQIVAACSNRLRVTSSSLSIRASSTRSSCDKRTHIFATENGRRISKPSSVRSLDNMT